MSKDPDVVIYGLHTVQMVLQRNPAAVHALYIDATRIDQRMHALIEVAQLTKLAIHKVSKNDLEQQVGEVAHQGVVAHVAPRAIGDENELFDLLDALDAVPFLLVLDGVQDPHNLGACLRTADAAGIHAVIAPKDRACGLTATVRKVACGAAEVMPFIQVTNLARTLRGLKERGIWCVGLDANTDSSLYQLDLRGPLALVMGAEGTGLRQLTCQHMDHLGQLPMAGAVSSLNVSVSTGIALYEAVRQRKGIAQKPVAK
jgi:23S rRNA (guanosine2251-2'-O)-methyltransferase